MIDICATDGDILVVDAFMASASVIGINVFNTSLTVTGRTRTAADALPEATAPAEPPFDGLGAPPAFSPPPPPTPPGAFALDQLVWELDGRSEQVNFDVFTKNVTRRGTPQFGQPASSVEPTLGVSLDFKANTLRGLIAATLNVSAEFPEANVTADLSIAFRGLDTTSFLSGAVLFGSLFPEKNGTLFPIVGEFNPPSTAVGPDKPLLLLNGSLAANDVDDFAPGPLRLTKLDLVFQYLNIQVPDPNAAPLAEEEMPAEEMPEGVPQAGGDPNAPEPVPPELVIERQIDATIDARVVLPGKIFFFFSHIFLWFFLFFESFVSNSIF